MLAVLLHLFTAAHAATYTNVRFCGSYGTDFDDASSSVGDDYLTSNAGVAARGARIRVTLWPSNALVWDGYAGENYGVGGAAPGCTDGLTLDSGSAYKVTMYSVASVGGDVIRVYNDDVNQALKSYLAFVGYVPTASNTSVAFTTSLHHMWDIAASEMFVQYRLPDGHTGDQFTSYAEGCLKSDGSHDGLCCHSSGVVYQGPAGETHEKKYVQAHEFGHCLFKKDNGGVGCPVSYDLEEETACRNPFLYEPGELVTHEMNSKEFASSAAYEGLAHFVAAAAFNDSTDSSCYFNYYKRPIDWNANGTNESAEATWNLIVGCENGIAALGVGPAAYLEEFCGDDDILVNRGTEYDYLRTLWDLHSDDGLTFAQLMDVFVDAKCAGGTTPSGATVPAWNGTGDAVSSDNPYPRLRTSAVLNGWGSVWDAEASYNGIVH